MVINLDEFVGRKARLCDLVPGALWSSSTENDKGRKQAWLCKVAAVEVPPQRRGRLV